MHIKAHGPKGNDKYSLNYLLGVGRAYAEGIEGNWANTNGAALSTREMSKSGRHETLDDLFSSINWCRIVGTGKLYASSLFSVALMNDSRHFLSFWAHRRDVQARQARYLIQEVPGDIPVPGRNQLGAPV